jgi:hypothetical protein
MFKINKDQRQYLNLSTLAHSVLLNDMEAFTEGGNKSGFLNKILKLYMPYADASVSRRLDERRAELDAMLHMAESSEKERIISVLLEEYKEKLLAKTEYPKEISLGWDFRLDDENAAYLYATETPCPEEAYYKRGSDYIKAVIEEYSRLTMYDREAVLLREQIAFIEEAMQKRQMLRVTTGGQMFEVRAYGILPDEQNRYHYLVGYSRPYKSKEPELIASFRLSRIDHDKTRMLSSNNNHSGKVTKNQKKDIENTIAKKGVMFLMGPAKTVYIRLTEEGRNIYDRKLAARPMLAAPGENSKYYGQKDVFTCYSTLRNVTNYFFDFGAHAEILEPSELRETFANRYARASRLYEKE